MASCFEVAMALLESGDIEDKNLDEVTTVLVETLLATGTIKERSRAVEEHDKEEEIYKAAEDRAAADDARADFEDTIRQAEIMLDARDQQLRHKKVIIEADDVIAENARLATAALVEKSLIDSAKADQVRQLIAEAWAE